MARWRDKKPSKGKKIKKNQKNRIFSTFFVVFALKYTKTVYINSVDNERGNKTKASNKKRTRKMKATFEQSSWNIWYAKYFCTMENYNFFLGVIKGGNGLKLQEEVVIVRYNEYDEEEKCTKYYGMRCILPQKIKEKLAEYKSYKDLKKFELDLNIEDFARL